MSSHRRPAEPPEQPFRQDCRPCGERFVEDAAWARALPARHATGSKYRTVNAVLPVSLNGLLSYAAASAHVQLNSVIAIHQPTKTGILDQAARLPLRSASPWRAAANGRCGRALAKAPRSGEPRVVPAGVGRWS